MYHGQSPVQSSIPSFGYIHLLFYFFIYRVIAQYCACSKLVFSSKQPLSTICFLLSILLLSRCDCGDGETIPHSSQGKHNCPEELGALCLLSELWVCALMLPWPRHCDIPLSGFTPVECMGKYRCSEDRGGTQGSRDQSAPIHIPHSPFLHPPPTYIFLLVWWAFTQSN